MTEEKIMATKFAMSFRAARALLGLSLKDVAEYCDTTAVTVGKWETSQLEMKYLTVMKIVKYFESKGVTFDIQSEGLGIRMTEVGLLERIDQQQDSIGVNKRTVTKNSIQF